MQKLVLILLAFFAVFTYIRAYEKPVSFPEGETASVMEITVEIVQ